MYLTYTELIDEDPDELARLERHYRHTSLAHRLQMLRLLKTGAYRSRRALAQLLGYSERLLRAPTPALVRHVSPRRPGGAA